MSFNNGGPYGNNPWGAPPESDPYRQRIATTRGTFLATGGAFIAMYLLLKIAPVFAGGVLGGVFGAINGARPLNEDPAYNILSGLLNLATIPLGVIYAHEFLKFEWNNTVLEGRRVRYMGDLGSFVSSLALPAILTGCTFGIYTPWFMCAYYRYIFDHSDVEGERLQFTGTGGELFGPMLLNFLLTLFTFGIAWPWAANNLWTWYWQNTGLNGRPFSFRKDGGELFGVALLQGLLTLCTFGIYWPWAAATLRKWELEHVA